MEEELRKLPSVNRVLGEPSSRAELEEYGRELVLAAIREVLSQARSVILAGGRAPSEEELRLRLAARLAEEIAPSLLPVINATGVIIHTNLGRAPLSQEALESVVAAARGYDNLEFDLASGRRGTRHVHAEAMLKRLTGAEGALVVNNNAGAVLLMLSALARGRQVLISRGQLVEIGGGFRVPDVMHESGAKLLEVGTTNRTYLSDYERAIGDETAALLLVHRSNFRLAGFTHEPELRELVNLGRRYGLPVLHDLGSGALLDTAQFGLAHEPTVQESLSAGVGLVSFSGDKLLGGPQAGIILGRAELTACLKEHPLARALRVDKLTLSALEATLRHYLKGEALAKVPAWKMIGAPLEELGAKAQRWVEDLAALGVQVEVLPGESAIGGGSLPGETLPTCLVAISVPSADALARKLRLGEPPVVARVAEGRVILDPRTVLPEEEALLLGALKKALVE